MSDTPILDALTSAVLDSAAIQVFLEPCARSAALHGVPSGERDDVVQEALLKLVRAHRQGTLRLEKRTEASARAYLSTTVKRVWIDALRRKHGEIGKEDPETFAAAPEPASPEPALEDLLEELNSGVVEASPALAKALPHLRALETGAAKDAFELLPPELTGDARTRARATLYQHQSRWRREMLAAARARLEGGTLDADTHQALEKRLNDLRTHAPKGKKP